MPESTPSSYRSSSAANAAQDCESPCEADSSSVCDVGSGGVVEGSGVLPSASEPRTEAVDASISADSRKVAIRLLRKNVISSTGWYAGIGHWWVSCNGFGGRRRRNFRRDRRAVRVVAVRQRRRLVLERQNVLHPFNRPVVRPGCRSRLEVDILDGRRQNQLGADSAGYRVRYIPVANFAGRAVANVVPKPARVRHGEPDAGVARLCAELIVRFLHKRIELIFCAVENRVEIRPAVNQG
ncbi:hypothetical protein SDC9_140524 [bioreactor metagenome]|uniref:Uncharacterized protein n=1 Tax=bioreactor metagenome TaxID=1076179 RepID=A0A645DVI8_9ZZZZ